MPDPNNRDHDFLRPEVPTAASKLAELVSTVDIDGQLELMRFQMLRSDELPKLAEDEPQGHGVYRGKVVGRDAIEILKGVVKSE